MGRTRNCYPFVSFCRRPQHDDQLPCRVVHFTWLLSSRSALHKPPLPHIVTSQDTINLKSANGPPYSTHVDGQSLPGEVPICQGDLRARVSHDRPRHNLDRANPKGRTADRIGKDVSKRPVSQVSPRPDMGHVVKNRVSGHPICIEDWRRCVGCQRFRPLLQHRSDKCLRYDLDSSCHHHLEFSRLARG